MQLLEQLQYHIQKIQEGQYFWDKNETGGTLEVLFDPTPRELQDFLKDYPICKAVSDGYEHWAFAYGQKICHDTLDSIIGDKFKTRSAYLDDHLSVTKNGLILGYREAGSFESSLAGVFDLHDVDEEPFNKQECYGNLKLILAAITSLTKKYTWLKPSPSLLEELQALKNIKHLKYTQPKWYKW